MTLLPSLVKGMRDYSSLQVYRRNYMLAAIQAIYTRYGFEPLETPALEHRSTLTGKYGSEGEQLMFNVLKSGDFLEGIEANTTDYKKLKALLSDKGLRYDLTVPLMRHIAAHQHEICFPFRRYQMQPVWRADRPQRGRYREFLQCDADIIGSTSLLCEAEILKLIYDVCTQLNIRGFCIKINHRGILSAIADPEKEKEKLFCTIVDKLEKIGLEKMIAALQAAGFSSQATASLVQLQNCNGSHTERLGQLQAAIGDVAQGAKAIEELSNILTQAHGLGLPDGICCIDPTLARGLAYYTGLVMELTVAATPIGSLGGGGRYANLGALFGAKGLTGVGFSFGIDRLYDLMEAQNIFQSITTYTTEVLLTNLEAKAEMQLLHLLNQLRTAGIQAEIYPQRVKINKQLSYAHKKNIPFVVIVGETEYAMDHYTLKNMQTGVQNRYRASELLGLLKTALATKC
ncbi:MAG: histidine--tRNA ligase [Candidatus Cardinium sp.]